MYTVDTNHPAGQAYYDSVFRLYASWGVDFVKVDDILADGSSGGQGPYHGSEVEAIRSAIDRCGRHIVLSLSPGDAPLAAAAHVQANANIWRMSADFWDDWIKLKRMFTLCEQWWPYRRPGAWPDADILPLGRICKRGPKTPERDSRFTLDEARTLLTLWAIFKSPLMIGGNLPETDAATLGLLTNRDVLSVNQNYMGGRPLENTAVDLPVWVSESPDGAAKAVALFNLRDEPADIEVSLTQLGIKPRPVARELWTRTDAITINDLRVKRHLRPHSAVLLNFS
jgi:hypothetical protein